MIPSLRINALAGVTGAAYLKGVNLAEDLSQI